MRTRTRRAGAAPVAVAAVLALALGLGTDASASAAGTTDVSANTTPAGRYIVKRDTTVPERDFEAALAAAGITLVRTQDALAMAVVDVPDATSVDQLRVLPGVTSVAADYDLEAQSLGFDAGSQVGSMTNVTAWTGAQNMWKAGYTGAGVDVALIDTGVAPVPTLSSSEKVVVGPDLSFESQTDATRYLDTYGHGTAMAGIIAGREGSAASGSSYASNASKNYYGMAPDARIVSLKLADRNGIVDISQVIAAIDWVTTNRKRNGLNVRVLNLAYGANSRIGWAEDPLSWATEAAWHEGITIVASAGNDGAWKAGLASPAFNPWVIAVGASDTKGTATVADDSVAYFSQAGAGVTRGPDLVAPGVGIISPSDPGGYIATTYPGALFGNGFIRGSGTSQAAAVVSGAAALVLQKYPSLTPDELKRYLMRTASTLPNADSDLQGKGQVFLNKVLTESPDWGYKQSSFLSVGNGTGDLGAARNGAIVNIGGIDIWGEHDIMGNTWDSATQAVLAATDKSWTRDGQFNGAHWTGEGFTADTTSWAGKTWQGKTWQGKTWQGKTWQGKTWQTGYWTGTGWSSSTWSGPTTPAPWTTALWSTSSWG